MAFDPLPAATALRTARAQRQVASLPSAIAPRDEAEGVAVQVALAGLAGASVPAGFKIAAISLAMQTYLGLGGPIAAFMGQAGLLASGAVAPWDDFRSVGVECEIGVRLKADLPPGSADPAAAVGELFAAIEIVENRYAAPAGVPLLVADQIYHAAAVLGAPASGWRGMDLANAPGRITVDGDIRGEGVGGDLMGHPMAALAWLADAAIVRAFGGLRAGQVVMLGSVTPPIWLDGPCEATVAFEGMQPATLRLRR
jgi:2-keto-4-pentenoate hydratase